MPPGKRRKVSQDENTARDGGGSRLIAHSVSDEKSANDLTTSPTSEKRVRLATSKGDAVEKTDDDGKTSPQGTTGKRSSTRVVKKVKRDISPQGSPVKKVPKEPVTKTGTPEAKTKRQWEQWQEEDIKTFFDALFEHGKDFEAIQNVLTQRCKKRSVHPSLMKNKDQVRHFYYRTCHKIYKFIQTTNDVKKDTQELYALINYGILRDTIKNRLNAKTALKLRELIDNGVTNVRVKGKNKRIRTPACSALKKLNNIEEPKEDASQPQVPDRIILELGPKSNDAWSHVHSMAHNPRLRLKLPGDRSVGAVIALLVRKWKERRVRLIEGLNESEAARMLTLYPHRESQISPVLVTRFNIPKVDITFASYKESIMSSPSTSTAKLNKKSAAVEETHKPTNDSSSETDNASASPTKLPRFHVESNPIMDTIKSEKMVCPSREMSILMGDDNAMFPDRMLCFEEDASGKSSVSVAMLASSDKAQDVDDGNVEPAAGSGNKLCETGADSLDSQDFNDDSMRKVVEKAKIGWTEESGKTVTLAQVYLMCGSEGVVRLEYDWTTSDDQLTVKLTNMLRRLAHIATIEFRDPTRAKPTTEGPPNKSVLCQLCGALAERAKHQNKPASAKSKITKGDKSTVESVTTEAAMLSQSSVEVSSSVTISTTVLHPRMPLSIHGGKPQVVMSCNDKQIITNTGDGVFRVPVGVPLVRYPNTGLGQVMQSLQQKQPNFLIPKRRKMVRQKPMIVQRTLLPKAPSGQIVTLLPSNPGQVTTNVLSPQTLTQSPQTLVSNQQVLQSSHPQTLTPQTFSPASLNTPMADSNRQTVTQVITSHTLTPMSAVVSDQSPMVSGSGQPINMPLSVNTDIAVANQSGLLSGPNTPVSTSSGQTISSRSGDFSISPPNLSSLLDMSLSCPPPGNAVADKLLDLALVNSNSSFSGFLDTTSLKCAADTAAMSLRPVDENSRLTTPPHSPSRIGESGDTHWLHGDVNDMSLTSFLTISPSKKSDTDGSHVHGTSHFPANIFSENSQESIVAKMDVDTTLQVMMNENSMDYMSKFESLIHITGPASCRNKDNRP